MKILVSSDQHWHSFKEFDKLNEDGTSYRLSLYKKSLEYIMNYCIENKIEYWFDCGDLFHSRETISTEILDILGKTLKKIKEQGIKMFFIKGNHDTGNRKGDISTLNILSEYGAVIDDCQSIILIDCDNKKIDEQCSEIKIGLIPWDENLKIDEAVKSIGRCNLIFAHRMLKGAKQGGMILDGEDIAAIDQSNFDYMFVGHVHGMQKLTQRIIYVGSLMACNFNDTSDKGFFVYDTYTKNYEVVRNPHSPVFIQKDIKKLKDLENLDKNAFYDIKIVSEDEDAVNKSIEYLNSHNAEFAGIRATVIKKSVVENRVDSSQEMTPENILKQFIELNSLNDSCSRIGLDILKENK